jgi:hypothetical protein
LIISIGFIIAMVNRHHTPDPDTALEDDTTHEDNTSDEDTSSSADTSDEDTSSSADDSNAVKDTSTLVAEAPNPPLYVSCSQHSSSTHPQWHRSDLNLELFDLDDIPVAMEPDPGDAVEGDDILAALLNRGGPHLDERYSFEAQRAHVVSVSKMKSIYERGDEQRAIDLLRKRTSLKWDPCMITDGLDEMLTWEVNNHFIDYLLLVSASIGLHAIIPNKSEDPGYSFNLSLTQPYRPFAQKYATLGFDPAGRMLFVGTVGLDNVYIALAPRRALNGSAERVPNGSCSGSTHLKQRHYLAVCSFLAWAMKRQKLCNIYSARNGYPDIVKGPAAFKRETNIL